MPRTPRPREARRRKSAIGWGALLGYRQVWAIVLARFMVDPIWWLYITWLPKYLSDARGFSLAQIGLYAWVPYLAADAGSLTGGALSGYLISRGWSVDRARKTVIAAAAALMPAGILAVRAESAAVALALMCVVLFAFQVWINNVQTLPSDFFPSRAVGSVAGLGGFGAGLGSMLFTLTTGWVVDHFSYTPIFTAAGLLAPVGTIVLFALSGRVGRLPARDARQHVGGDAGDVDADGAARSRARQSDVVKQRSMTCRRSTRCSRIRSR